MNKRIIKLISFILLFIGIITIYGISIIPNYLKYENIYLSAFLSIYTFLLYQSFGIVKEINTLDKRIVKRKTLINIIIYFIIIYSLGFYLGFTYNGINFNLDNTINIVILQIIISINMELIRYILINTIKNNKLLIIITTSLLIILELLTSINLYRFSYLVGIYTFICISFLPILMKNILLAKFASNKVLSTNILYRLVTDLYLIVLPIIPSLGDYLICISSILLPFSILNSSQKVLDKQIIYKNNYFTDIIFSFLAIILIVLISGFTRYKLLSIASDSMNPVIRRGDSVIIKEYKSDEAINKGDIIAFKNDSGMIVVHRVLEVENESFITKGDFNNTEDKDHITKDEILGHVVITIPYLGYPSIWVSENTG